MAEKNYTKTVAVILLVLVVFFGLGGWNWVQSQGWFASGIQYQQDTGTGETGVITETGGTIIIDEALPTYQLATIKMYMKDQLDKDSGVSGNDVEVLELSTSSVTLAELSKLASNPQRQILDSGTSSSTGLVTFSSGSMYTNTPYVYSIRSNTTAIYDEIRVIKIPAPSKEFAITTHTMNNPVYVYKVGAYSNISADDADFDGLLTSTELSSLNLTGDSGDVFIEFDITIGQKTAGKVLKNPVMSLRSPEGYELESGDVKNLYIVKKTGTDFGVPVGELSGWIDSTPIYLQSSLTDTDGNGYATVADSGTYTVKLTVDSDTITAAGDRIQIALDDLGDYRAKDITTQGVKATPQSVTLVFEKA